MVDQGQHPAGFIYWGEFLQQVEKNFSLLLRSWSRCWKQEGNTLLLVKPCTSDTEAGVVEETIRIKEKPANEYDLKPSTTIAGKLKTTKTQFSRPDQVFVNVSEGPYQPKNFKDSNRWYYWFAIFDLVAHFFQLRAWWKILNSSARSHFRTSLFHFMGTSNLYFQPHFLCQCSDFFSFVLFCFVFFLLSCFVFLFCFVLFFYSNSLTDQ